MLESRIAFSAVRRMQSRLLLSAMLLGAWIAGCGTKPEDRAYSELLLKVRPQSLLGETSSQPDKRFEIFRETQARLIKSPFVFNAALRDSQVSGLPMIKEQSHPIEFLEQQIEVDNPATEFLRISFKGPRTKEAAIIVNAVTTAYLQEVDDWEEQSRTRRAKASKRRITISASSSGSNTRLSGDWQKTCSRTSPSPNVKK